MTAFVAISIASGVAMLWGIHRSSEREKEERIKGRLYVTGRELVTMMRGTS